MNGETLRHMPRERRDTSATRHVRRTLSRPSRSEAGPRARAARLSSVLESLARWENEGGATVQAEGAVRLRSQSAHTPEAVVALEDDAVVQRVG